MSLFRVPLNGRLCRYSFLKQCRRLFKQSRFLQANDKTSLNVMNFESNSGIQKYLQYVVQQHSELTQLLTSQDVQIKADKRRLVGKTVSKYFPLIQILEKINQKQEELSELDEIPLEDEEMKDMVVKERQRCQQELDNMKDTMFDNLVPAEVEDDNDVILEVRAGTGGQEACIFTMEIFNMYQKFSLHKKWNFSIVHISKSETGGFKEAIASISGKNVFGSLKYEVGVHRVQRVPATEATGRLHTSTMTVAVLPEPEEIDVIINQQDLKIDTFRSSGAGGQHVNTTDSAVRITHLPTGIVVSNQEERSQIKNRQKALRILRAKLFQRERETADRERSVARKHQIGSAERSDKIRTYNFPQNRITDHRAGVSVNNVEDFLKGGAGLRDVITLLQSHYRNIALECILQEYGR